MTTFLCFSVPGHALSGRASLIAWLQATIVPIVDFAVFSGKRAAMMVATAFWEDSPLYLIELPLYKLLYP
jgi:hypothetical protein